MSRPQNSVWTIPQPKNSPFGPQKLKNDPKIESKSIVTVEEKIENRSFSTTIVESKRILEPYPDPKKSQLGPKKVKNYPKIKSNSKIRIEGSIENESCTTISVHPKIYFEHKQNPK